jgi:membrane fusion protein, copper/silver efflux system
MTAKRMLLRLGVGIAIVVALGLLVIWWPKGAPETTAGSDIWTCSMHPQIRLPSPGRCPICGMALIPVSKLPHAQNDLETRAGLETEPIQRRELFKEIRTVGKLDYSERQVESITARIAGRVDRLFADFTGFDVKKGDHLVEIYSPELNVTQQELLIALDGLEKEKPPSSTTKSFATARLEASRTKLRLLGILDTQIAELEKSRNPTDHLTIYAPLGGTVIEKDVRVGQYVAAGDELYRIANLDPIWLYLNLYEFDIAWVRFGQSVDVALEAFPGETFTGSVMFIDPFLDDATRTIRVRVNIKNPDRRLKPQMFASATINVRLLSDGTPEPTGLEGKYICPMHPEVVQGDPGKCSICEMSLEKVPGHPKPERARGSEGEVTKPTEQADSTAGVLAIPVSAVLDTGRRRITYRLSKDGAYELVDSKLGPRAHARDESGRLREYFAVQGGLHEGDRVVTQSGFLLDSQRQIEGMPSLLYPTGQAASTSGHTAHGGHAEAPGGTKTPAPPAAMPSGHQH